MSEVLRAILSDKAIWRKPTFYTGLVSTVSTVTGTKTFAPRQAIIPCQADRWFLAMGAAQVAFGIFPAGGGGFIAGKNEDTRFQIVKSSNQQPFSSALLSKSTLNFNLNNFVTWDEYVLFPPSESIVINMTAQVTDTTFVLNHSTFVTVVGIEYKMPG